MRTLIACSCLLIAAGAAADDCEYSRPMNAELDASGAEVLEIRAAAGFLIVEGDPSGSGVVVEGEACASKESVLDDIELITERRGDRLIVKVDIPNIRYGRSSPRLNLTLTVPTELPLDIEDGSGSIDIRNVAAIELDDGSGEVDIEDVTGTVVVRDGSGSIVIRGVGDGVEIKEDGSGEMRISDVQGDVLIRSDGSGGITIRDVNGSVRVGSDGSGSIHVARVSGGFELRSDGSGSVDLDEVEGTISMP